LEDKIVFRILCLDGGGIKGVFTAAALARIEDQTKMKVVDHFDLICGTSTGGILAIGLSMGLSAEDLLKFYRQRGAIIFPAMSLVERSAGLLRQLFFGPKLSHHVLKQELSTVLKNCKFGQAKCRLAIPSYDAVRGRIYVFKTPHNSRFVNDIDTPAVDVALATSAAPTYFAAAAANRDGRFVDGGVWANSPVMVALVEAVSFLNIPLGDIDILSIGSTMQPFSIAKNQRASALKWNIGLVNLMFEAQAEAAQAQAKLLLNGRVHRVNFVSTANRFSLDNASERAIGDLTNLGWTEVEKKKHTDIILKRFVNGKTVSQYEPLRTVA
jgi:patatin-like phospholipase/acyl hydrolase